MAALFTSASSQRLLNSSPPITAMPFSIGMWVNLGSTGTVQYFWSMTDNTSTTRCYRVGINATPAFVIAAGDTAITASVLLGLTPVANTRWFFVICRFVSATNRWLTVLSDQFGAMQHIQGTTSRTPTGINRIALGSFESSSPANFYGGLIGEYWMANGDIQGDGASTQPEFARQLAFGGPFSVPHVASSIVDYRSLRKSPASDADESAEVYLGYAGTQTWVNTNGATISNHPPLPYWYKSPQDFTRNVMV